MCIYSTVLICLKNKCKLLKFFLFFFGELFSCIILTFYTIHVHFAEKDQDVYIFIDFIIFQLFVEASQSLIQTNTVLYVINIRVIDGEVLSAEAQGIMVKRGAEGSTEEQEDTE